MSSGCLDPLDDARWAELARCRGGLFHSPPWLRAVHQTYQFETCAAVAVTATDEVTAGIPYAVLDGPRGPRVVAAPFCDSCDPIAAAPDEWDCLQTVLLAHDLPVHLRLLEWPCPPSEQGFKVVKRARWQTLEIAESSDERWRRLAPSTGRAIRKARRERVEVRALEPGPALAAFHRQHVSLRKTKYRLLAQPLRFFEAIADEFQASGGWHALGAWQGPHLVAGAVFLRWGDTLYYKFNTSAAEALPARPNTLLAFEGLELAAALGCRTLDFGPSDDDQPGLVRFKRQFGARERELRFVRWDPPGWDGRAEEAGKAMLHDVSALFTRPEVPASICANAGARLYQYFA